jgi:hypothetical protein
MDWQRVRQEKVPYPGTPVDAVRAAQLGKIHGKSSSPAFAQSTALRREGSAILPAPEPQFGGVIGRKASESKPDLPKAVTALERDVLQPIPHRGAVFTDAICASPRPPDANHQSVGFGNIPSSLPIIRGYDSIIPKSAGTIGNILVRNGYNTSWFGKHHPIPVWQQSSAGPFDQWAGGLGFECFYGFLGGDTDSCGARRKPCYINSTSAKQIVEQMQQSLEATQSR